jgi:transposase
MTPEKLFHELLGLGLNWRVEECEFDREQGVVRLKIAETEHLWEVERSPGAGAKAVCYDHTEEMTWRHLNVFEHQCEIRCRLPRGRCSKTGKVYRVEPPWEGLSKHFTKSFEAMTLLLMREMPVAVVGRHVGETDTRLWRMLKAHVSAAYPQADWSNVICVGCDEMSVRKGQHYISVFCDLIGKRVLFAVEGRDKKVWEAFVQALGEHNGHPRALVEISMDMSPAYIGGVRENVGSQATIVFDKYHVIAHANEAVDQTRRIESRMGMWPARNGLKESRWIWLKNPENLTEKQRSKLQKIDRLNLATAKAYQMRLSLQDIYQLPDRGLAKRKLLAWCRWVRRVAKRHTSLLFSRMLKCAEMIESHLPGILAYWDHHTTNAFMEALNSVFSAVKRKARGYRSIENLITMLYFTAAKLRIPAAH